MTTIFGIKNCDTIKKAKKWLDDNNIEYTFHDYRVDGVDKAMLETFVAELGWENLLNKRGTTWRQLPDEVKNSVDAEKALDIMIENPAIIKRPVLQDGDNYHLGFKADQYQTFFNQ